MHLKNCRRSTIAAIQLFLTVLISTVIAKAATIADSAAAGLKQFPAISRTHIAFIYANNLWCVSRDGGVATQLTDAPGGKSNVQFSPDGKSIAFEGNLEGNYEIYTIPITGGAARRITHLPA